MDAEARDRMVARVQTVYAKYPTFMSLPEVKGGNLNCVVKTDDNTEYVNALYQICAVGNVLGRGRDRIMGQTGDEVFEGGIV